VHPLATPPSEGDSAMRELDNTIDRWVAAGLIDTTTANRLRGFEVANASEPLQPPPPASGSLALIGEVVGYLGAVLAVSAIAFMVRQTWTDLSTLGKLALVGVLLVVVGMAGVMAARVRKPPAERLASVLFLATVALAGWFAWVVAHNGLSLGETASASVVTGVLATVAVVVYLLRRRALAQLALLVSLIAFLVAVVTSFDISAPFSWEGVVIAVVGAVWIGLSMARLLEPDRIGLVAGGLATIIGLESAAFDDSRGWILSLGVVAGVAMLAISVARRGEFALIVPGAIGLLVMVPQLIDHLFSDNLATWLAVLVTGVALVGVAVWMVRERSQGSASVSADA